MRLPEAPAPGDYPLHPTAATHRIRPFPEKRGSLSTYLLPSTVAVTVVPFSVPLFTAEGRPSRIVNDFRWP
eukprot:5172976-Pleurochrysis_carterae.AAC.1